MKSLNEINVLFTFSNAFLVALSFFLIALLQGLDNKYIIVCIMLSVPFKLFTNYTSSVALSYRLIAKLNITQAINTTTIFIFICLLALFDFLTIETYFISVVFGNIANAIYTFHYANKIDGFEISFKNLNFKNIPSRLILLKGITYSLPLFIYGINYKIDIIILNRFVSSFSVGVYSQGVVFAELLWQIPTLLSTIIFSYSVSSKNSKEFSIKLWKNSLLLMIGLIPIVLLIFFTCEFFIVKFYGIEFIESAKVVKLLLPGTFLIILFNILNGDLSAKGKPHISLIIFTLTGILNILLNIVVIPYYEIYGAALISTFTYILAVTLFLIYYYKNVITSK